jgi:hypothetical protein
MRRTLARESTIPSCSSFHLLTSPVVLPYLCPGRDLFRGSSAGFYLLQEGALPLVAAGAVDMAIGGDQGGSIRIPSCWCGIYGLKPTYGLVPYTGIFPIELTIFRTGPMARTVADVALLLR